MKIIVLFLLLILTSCVQKIPIYYNTENIIPITDKPIPISVNINVFQDLRNNPENEILFNNNPKMQLGDNTYCINSEKHYESRLVAKKISQHIAEHFQKARVFEEVVFNKKNADYHLTGKIVQIFAIQDYNWELGQINRNLEAFERELNRNMPSGIVVSLRPQIKSLVQFYFDISDLKLIDRKGNVIMELGGFEVKYQEEYRINSDCTSIYFAINQQLKVFINEIAIVLHKELSESKFWEQ